MYIHIAGPKLTKNELAPAKPISHREKQPKREWKRDHLGRLVRA